MRFRAATPEDVAWFTSRTSYQPGPQFKGIVAGDRAAMVGLDYWTLSAVQIHITSTDCKALILLWKEVKRWLSEEGRKLVVAVTPSDNETSLRLQRALGFKERYRQTDGWDTGIDMVLSEYKLQ